MWQWFKRQDFWNKLYYSIISIGIAYILFDTISFFATINYAQEKTDCGIFERYDEQVKSGKGSTWTNRWLVIKGQTGKYYQFMYHPKYHKSFFFAKTDLKQGQKVCFSYVEFWKTDGVVGKTFLKSIQLTGDK